MTNEPHSDRAAQLKRFETWARLARNMGDDLADDYPDLAFRFRELADLCADVAAVVAGTTAAGLPAGWRGCPPCLVSLHQFNCGACDDVERDYPNGWTGLVGLRPGGWFWQLSDRDYAGVSSATARSLVDAMSRCDAEWEARSGNSS